MNFWKVAKGDDGILIAEMDLGESYKKNILKQAVLEELSVILDKAISGNERKLEGMIITSAKKETFCAGADIKEFLPLLEHPKKASGLLQDAENLLLKILHAPFPIVAAINGECFGGGLELALACRYRIAARHPKVKFSFPETSLGIIPGFGGTQLLPRFVSMETAAEMILSNKELSAEEAFQRGLIHALAKPDDLILSAKGLIRLGDAIVPKRNFVRRRWIERLPGGWRIILKGANKKMLSRTKGLYPAYQHAVEALRYSKGDLKTGLRREHELFIKCLETPEARNSINFFFLESKARNTAPAMPVSLPEHYGVIGAGAMGQGIAYALLSTGKPVHLHDLFQSAVENGREAINALIYKGLDNKKITQENAERMLNNLTVSHGDALSEFADCDFVVEAIREDIAVKHGTLRILEVCLPKSAVIATNTSSLLPSEIAACLERPERLVAMHFFNPVHKMKLVEIVGHSGTSPEVVAKTVAVTKAIGKLPIVLDKECPGLLVNRVLMQFLAKAVGGAFGGHVDPWELDRVCEAHGMEMGPFKMLDHVGLDVSTDVLHSMQGYYPDRLPESVQKINFAKAKDRGLLGRKSGKGFYFWKGDKAVEPNYAVGKVFGLNTYANGDKAMPKYFLEKILEAMRSEAEEILREGVCLSRDTIDFAMIRGAGMMHNRRGIFGIQEEKENKEVTNPISN